MSRVLRPFLLLLLIFAIGIGVIYLDQTNQIPGLQSSPTVTPTDKPTQPSGGQDPYNKLH